MGGWRGREGPHTHARMASEKFLPFRGAIQTALCYDKVHTVWNRGTHMTKKVNTRPTVLPNLRAHRDQGKDGSHGQSDNAAKSSRSLYSTSSG